MYYRYNINDINCESFRYARLRAKQLYRRLKRRFSGELADLQQSALLAVIELGREKKHHEGLKERDLFNAVDAAIMAEVKNYSRSYRSPISFNHPTKDVVLRTNERIELLEDFISQVKEMTDPSELDTVIKAILLDENLSDPNVQRLVNKIKGLIAAGLDKELVEKLLA